MFVPIYPVDIQVMAWRDAGNGIAPSGRQVIFFGAVITKLKEEYASAVFFQFKKGFDIFIICYGVT